MATSDSIEKFQEEFLEKFQELPENMTNLQSIYRIPSLLRDLDPNAYEPRVVSIGPYHHRKAQLQEMEKHKLRVLHLFLSRNGGFHSDDILAELKREEPQFLTKVRNCYAEPLEPQWSNDNVFLHLLVLDGCFLLDLVMLDNRFDKQALLSYVKMDMLMLDNQIPLFFLRKLANIIAKLVSDRPSTSEPTGYEDVPIRFENLNINELIWKFYGNMNDDIPKKDARHVLDAYREGCIRIHYVLDAYMNYDIRTDTYDGWASSRSVRELYYHGVEFRVSGGGGVTDGFVAMGSFTDVAFEVEDNNFLTLWWRYTFGIAKGMFYLPRLTIDGTTRPTLLNLMTFERFHLLYSETHPITNYVLLMGSLIRSEYDVEHLRKESILLCSPGWTNKSVVKLFADLTRNVVFNGTRRTNTEIDGFCKKPSNRIRSFWSRVASSESSDAKAWCLLLLTLYGLVITIFNTIFTVLKYFD